MRGHEDLACLDVSQETRHLLFAAQSSSSDEQNYPHGIDSSQAKQFCEIPVGRHGWSGIARVVLATSSASEGSPCYINTCIQAAGLVDDKFHIVLVVSSSRRLRVAAERLDE